MPQNDAVRQSAASMSQTVLALAPTVLGLMIARYGPYRFRYGSYSSTDQGIYTDGSSILAMLPLFVFMCVLGKTRIKLAKKHICAHLIATPFKLRPSSPWASSCSQATHPRFFPSGCP